MSKIERELIGVEGRRLAYARLGRGPSVVLLHGIPTHMHLWRNVADRLVSGGMEVLMLDLLGFGSSDKPVDFDLGLSSQACLIASALDELNWPGGTIVGHDIGGGVVQLLVLAKPNLAKRLVLVDTIAYDSFPEPGIARLKDPAWDNILGAAGFDLCKGLAKGFVRGMVHSERVTPDLVAAYELPFHGVKGRLAYLRAARALRTEELSTRMSEVEHLALPTLIVWGAKDLFQAVRYGQRLAAAMPNARLEVLLDAGHFLPEDAPYDLARLILDFDEADRESVQ